MKEKTLHILLLIYAIFLTALVGCIAQTRQEVYNELIKQEIHHPDIVMAQIRLESANLTSPLFKANRNFAGMKLAKQRKTTAQGERYDYAYYLHWKDCIADLKIYQETYYDGEENYYDFLKRMGYAMSKSYIKKLKEFKSNQEIQE